MSLAPVVFFAATNALIAQAPDAGAYLARYDAVMSPASFETDARMTATREDGSQRTYKMHVQKQGFDKVRSYIESYARAIVTFDFGRCVATLDDSELSDQARRQVRHLKRRIDAAIQRRIEEGIADGSIAACNVKMASFAIAGAINWIGTWYRPGGGLGAEEIVAEFTRILTVGLQSCETRGAAPAKRAGRRGSRA